MAQTTEAACLLQSGAMYPRRIGFKTEAGDDLFAGVKPGAVSIYFGDAPIYHFDLDGRWQRAFVDGVHYLKGLDTTVQSIDREREGETLVLRRNTLPFGRTVDLDASIRAIALDLIDNLDSGRLEPLPTPEKARTFAAEEFRAFLERVIAWDSTAWFAHRERYLGTYGPIPFLPPDCPNALVLQATLGDRHGRAFGRSQPAEHYVRTLPEFEQHVRTVAQLLGRRIGQYNGIFLAGADVLQRPQGDLQGYFETIHRVFPISPAGPGPDAGWDEFATNLGPIHIFLDDFAEPQPTPNIWDSLKSAKLARVTLGLTSGSAEIRETYGRSWLDEDVRSVVAGIKGAGISLGLVVLLGSGGRAKASEHFEATASLLESLGLGPTDLVTLVDSRSLDQAPPEGVEPLTDLEIAAEARAFKSRLAAGRPSKGPKVVVYNPDKQTR